MKEKDFFHQKFYDMTLFGQARPLERYTGYISQYFTCRTTSIQKQPKPLETKN